MRPHAGPLCTARTEWAPELSPAGRRIVIYSWPRAGCSVDHDRLGVLPITKRLPAPTSIDGSNVRWLERCAWRLNTPRRTKSDWRRRTITMPTGARRSATASSWRDVIAYTATIRFSLLRRGRPEITYYRPNLELARCRTFDGSVGLLFCPFSSLWKILTTSCTEIPLKTMQYSCARFFLWHNERGGTWGFTVNAGVIGLRVYETNKHTTLIIITWVRLRTLNTEISVSLACYFWVSHTI